MVPEGYPCHATVASVDERMAGVDDLIQQMANDVRRLSVQLRPLIPSMNCSLINVLFGGAAPGSSSLGLQNGRSDNTDKRRRRRNAGKCRQCHPCTFSVSLIVLQPYVACGTDHWIRHGCGEGTYAISEIMSLWRAKGMKVRFAIPPSTHARPVQTSCSQKLQCLTMVRFPSSFPHITFEKKSFAVVFEMDETNNDFSNRHYTCHWRE